MSRAIWFAAGAGAGVYAMIRARRAAEALTPEGIRDRWSGLGHGARIFGDEVRAGMAEKETELRRRLGMPLDGPLALAAGDPQERPGASPDAAGSESGDVPELMEGTPR